MHTNTHARAQGMFFKRTKVFFYKRHTHTYTRKGKSHESENVFFLVNRVANQKLNQTTAELPFG